MLGPGAVTAAGRRRAALEQEQLWRRERRAFALAAKTSHNVLRRGIAKLDWVIQRSSNGQIIPES